MSSFSAYLAIFLPFVCCLISILLASPVTFNQVGKKAASGKYGAMDTNGTIVFVSERNDTGSVYSIEKNLSLIFQSEIIPSGLTRMNGANYFGFCSDCSTFNDAANVLVVGAYQDDYGLGSAFVFELDSTTGLWVQFQNKLVPKYKIGVSFVFGCL